MDLTNGKIKYVYDEGGKKIATNLGEFSVLTSKTNSGEDIPSYKTLPDIINEIIQG